MSEQNKQVLLDQIDSMNSGDFALLTSLYDENVAYHASGSDEQRGRTDVVGVAEMYKAAFPDLRFEAELVAAEGDTVFALTRAAGTHTGPLGEMQPAGKKVDVQVVVVLRVRDGRIVEEWNIYDTADFMRQLGVS